MSLAPTLFRVGIGALFTAHGLQKLTGAFDGPGPEGTTGMMQALGLRPAAANARAAALTETIGGAALAIGAATPVAAAGLTATMLTAVRTVHWPKGFWNAGGGWEFNAVLVAAVAAAAEHPGPVSIDALFGKAKWGVGGALLAVLGGVAGAAAVQYLSEQQARADEAFASSDGTASTD